jgi:hypothetical protein
VETAGIPARRFASGTISPWRKPGWKMSGIPLENGKRWTRLKL